MRTLVSAAAMVVACTIVTAFAVEGMDWAYPVAPRARGRPTRRRCSRCRAARSNTRRPRSATASIRRTGSRTNMRRCRRWLRTGGQPVIAPVRSAICRPAAVIRIRQRVRSSRSTTSSAQMEEYKNGNRVGSGHPHDRDRQGDHGRGYPRGRANTSRRSSRIRGRRWSRARPRRGAFVGGGGMRFAHAEGGTEPIGSRIILIPDSAEGAQLRNPKSNFVAYVPKGSIARGKELAAGGGGKTMACGSCHGRVSRESAPCPASQARIRLYRSGSSTTSSRAAGRASGGADEAVVEKLTLDDMIALSAYTASLNRSRSRGGHCLRD